MDKGLLRKLIETQSSSTEDTDINNFIEKHLNSIKGVKVEKDSYGNIYATKGNGQSGYVCSVAHTDTVHSIKPNRKVLEYDNFMYCMAVTKSAAGREELVQAGTGGDDKCGIYVCLKNMEEFDNIKTVYFRFEETGCKGSNAANMDFFNDCNFVVQADRRNYHDIIFNISGIPTASKEFIDKIEPLYKKHGFVSTTGISTDVGTLKRNGLPVCTFNISSGYVNPHTSTEYIDMDALDNTYAFISNLFKQFGTTKFEHKYERVQLPSFSFTRKFFSNTLEDNILMKEETQIAMFEISEPSIFLYVGGGYYKAMVNDLLYLDDVGCESCGDTNSLAFSMYDGEVYCTNSKCGQVQDDDSIYENIVVEDNEMKFAFDRFTNMWIKKEDAIWNNEIKTYILK